MHLIHYGFARKFIVLHVPWGKIHYNYYNVRVRDLYNIYFLIFLANTWFRFPKEITDSVFMPDKLDLPIHAGLLLKYFKSSNASLLSELDVSSA